MQSSIDQPAAGSMPAKAMMPLINGRATIRSSRKP